MYSYFRYKGSDEVDDLWPIAVKELNRAVTLRPWVRQLVIDSGYSRKVEDLMATVGGTNNVKTTTADPVYTLYGFLQSSLRTAS